MDFSINGQPVYAYTGGRNFDPAAGSVVFIHGAANDHSVWALQSRYFAWHGMNAIAVDLPGHGRSGGAPLDSVAALADWLDAMLAKLEIDRATLVGHSMGSLVALATAAHHPQRVDKLALIGCTVPMGVSDALLAAARDDVRTAIAMITQWSHAPATLLGGSPLPGLWLPAVNTALMARAAAGVLHRDLLNCRDYTDGLAAAAMIDCPALIIAGKNDLMTPLKSIEPLRAALRRSQLATIDGAGHAMLSERADAVLDALRVFVG